MTNLEALKGEIEPYTPSRLTLEKALKDAGLIAGGEYSDQRAIAVAAVKALQKMIVLSSEGESDFSQGYKPENLEKRIRLICNEYSLDASIYVDSSSISDGSNYW
ncbi:MAG: DUF6706 family protein [Mangrovibacterium sp.]